MAGIQTGMATDLEATGGDTMIIERFLSQRVVGYRHHATSPSETVFESVVLMRDGTTATIYTGTGYDASGMAYPIEYGSKCPTLDVTQQEAT
jgi:hypothetical protein